MRGYRLLWTGWAAVNLAAFIAALILPLVQVQQLFVFENDVILIRVPLVLIDNGERLLGVVVLLFGIVLPFIKAVLYCIAAARPRLIVRLGRFTPISYFDVFMIALLIFVAKGALGTAIVTAIGIYPLVFFALSTKAIDLVLRPKLASGES